MANNAEYGGIVKFVDDAAAEQYYGGVAGLDQPYALPAYFNTTSELIRVFNSQRSAIGSITCAVQANWADNDTLTAVDADGLVKVFEIDESGSAVLDPANIAVDISGETTAADVVDVLIPLLQAAGLDVTYTDGGDDIDMSSDTEGAIGRSASLTYAGAGTGVTAGSGDALVLGWQTVAIT